MHRYCEPDTLLSTGKTKVIHTNIASALHRSSSQGYVQGSCVGKKNHLVVAREVLSEQRTL